MGFLWFRGWFEKVLDAVQQHGSLVLFTLAPEHHRRLKALTRAECKQAIARLERLAMRPPERDDNDRFGDIAGLLDEEGLPVDLDRIDALLVRIPFDHKNRRERLYRMLGRLQTRDSLDRLMRHVVARHNDPAFEMIWSALITTTRTPKHVDVLFPRLSSLLDREDCAAAVIDVANAFKDQPHPLREHGHRLLHWLQADVNEDLRSAAAWTLGLIEYRAAADALHAATTVGGRRLPVEAAQALVRLGDPRGPEAFAELCRNPVVRWRAVEYLKEARADSLIPTDVNTPSVAAEDALRRWLEHPNEYGRPPDEVLLLDASRRHWAGQGVVPCWLFRYRYGEEWDVGIAGPVVFSLFGKRLDSLPIEQIYRAYEEWDVNPKRGAPAFQELAKDVLKSNGEGAKGS
jgi:hypothetical protein